ncbi:MAG: flagellar hook protein FlgE [Bdellovibrionales bacterium]|nr:flagellar hook protein FlgE [Bdellovibrionales bacterium]
MGILSSMYTGISGMRGSGEALSVYGDNIANANTTGFKVSRPEFQDLVSTSLKNMSGGNQVGRGSRLASVAPIMSQGSIVATEAPTDLAISGDGMFVMRGAEGQSYSRAGNFRFDRDGKLVNSEGYRVQGFQADETGKMTSKMSDISIDRSVVDAKQTKKVDLFMNLDMRTDTKVEFDPQRPESTSNFATGITVYDSAGTPRTVSMFINKSSDGEWTWRVMAKGEDLRDGKPGTLVEQARGKLKFDTDGRLNEVVTDKNSFNFNKGAIGDQKIDFNFGPEKKKGGSGTQVTQYGTASEAYKTLQDGYSAGTLSGLSFNEDGILTGVYSNGQTINLCQVALAKFENPEGLFKLGQNLYRESRNSGQPTIGAPDLGGRGKISAKALESSTTDIANEFINLMQAQHNFQANSRVIRVADDMMQEVLNLKRS